MSVLSTVSLPDETGTNWVQSLPLHGDGLTHSNRQLLVNITQQGDATGGENRVHINLDDDYTHVVAYVAMIWSQPVAGDRTFRMDLKASNYETYEIDGLAVNRDIGYTSGSRASAIWAPPPTLCRNTDIGSTSASESGRISVRTPNINLEDVTTQLQILQFTKEAWASVPYAVLLAPLVRGTNVISS